ncbi:uncharacterized protein si:ch211-86h15.1 isoform X3 [Triplophysa dalaica]|uniref:uncharacterized protein si:ch211-86h15.1 isoform X3 n=1 Tax=Triplophysa dalaica TaxID=1582913 RepID=UPI0024DFDDA2|nr:uncharacterized protein si:ch211-86h15.1 isoform X3 [Triplophysa dalaica]
MAKLQILNVFLTERLTLAAQEIFKVVEDIFLEYTDEICRSRQEIELLRKRLQQAGLQLDSEMHSCESKETQTLSEEQWRSEQDGNDTEMQMKLEVYTQQEENIVHMSVYNESSSLLPSMDTGHNHMTNKDIESQIMDSSENDFPFTDQTAEIKNEPGLSEKGRDCQLQQFTRRCLDDPGASHASSVDKTEVINIDSSAHKTHTFHLPPRTQERLTLQHRMELAQIRERLAGDEQKKAAAKARSLKHKLKIYGNPELLEEYRKKERERYQRRKSQGKVKFAKDLNLSELRRQQKKWRERSAAHRRKKTFQEVLNNIKEDIDIIPESKPDTSA